MILFKEPTEEKKETPEAPKPMVVPVEKKVSLPEGTVLASITFVFSPCSLLLCLQYEMAVLCVLLYVFS